MFTAIRRVSVKLRSRDKAYLTITKRPRVRGPLFFLCFSHGRRAQPNLNGRSTSLCSLRFLLGLLFHDNLPCFGPLSQSKQWQQADERGVNQSWQRGRGLNVRLGVFDMDQCANSDRVVGIMSRASVAEDAVVLLQILRPPKLGGLFFPCYRSSTGRWYLAVRSETYLGILVPGVLMIPIGALSSPASMVACMRVQNASSMSR
jgi:hypothetical protein